ncbi:MAG TPA: Nif3-like dinuclear metal center hexameric protein [Thermomicrobiales bacterium]|nr:Nif3-like dinuclear metal center hexameric protein [Thermomicrobiales bacterium]
MASRADLIAYCRERLEPERYRDVAANGLQVEGAAEVERLAVAVSTSAHTIGQAAEWGAQAMLVHHGLLWGGGLQPLTGILGGRLRELFTHDINLIAYHLPLDGHPEIGNNALLARDLGLSVEGQFGEVAGVPLGVIAAPAEEQPFDEFLGAVARLVERAPLVVGEIGGSVRRVGILSGSGYSALAEAAELGCDALLTGDIREPTMAEARELGIAVIAAGHEATERLGVQALAAELAREFDIETRFFHDPNPV